MLEASLAWIKQQRRAKREADNIMSTEQRLAPSGGTTVAGMNNFEQAPELQQLAAPAITGMELEKTNKDTDPMEE